MNDPFYMLFAALALVMVIEGGLYALFPKHMKKMMLMALTMPEDRLRNMGLAMAILGAFVFWFLKSGTS